MACGPWPTSRDTSAWPWSSPSCCRAGRRAAPGAADRPSAQRCQGPAQVKNPDSRCRSGGARNVVGVEDPMIDAMSPPMTAEAPSTRAGARRVALAWRLLRDAVRGVPLDLTAAPIGKALVMLAVPMIMEMIMESIFAVVDV